MKAVSRMPPSGAAACAIGTLRKLRDLEGSSHEPKRTVESSGLCCVTRKVIWKSLEGSGPRIMPSVQQVPHFQ